MNWESYSHPISDIRDWNKNSRLELQPEFQRNEVWSEAAQIMLIDTILRGIPIPKIYIKSTIKDDDNTYRIVIDGQQRLTAILKFVNDDLKLKSPYNGPLLGKVFSELDEKTRNIILRYKIDINEIFNPSDEEIRDLYSRVNKYTVQLNKQELRKADFPGDFIKSAEKLSELEFFETSGIFTVRQRRRMLDVEFIEELLTLILEGFQEKKDYLDAVCQRYMVLDNQEEVMAVFKSAIEDIQLIFDPIEMPLSKTRFKQKADFYSLFSSVLFLKRGGRTIEMSLVPSVREKLKEMDEKIGPQSEEDEYREYATRCLSDANSLANRTWRNDFIGQRLEECYV